LICDVSGSGADGRGKEEEARQEVEARDKEHGFVRRRTFGQLDDVCEE
jgi:hypothetical protein